VDAGQDHLKAGRAAEAVQAFAVAERLAPDKAGKQEAARGLSAAWPAATEQSRQDAAQQEKQTRDILIQVRELETKGDVYSGRKHYGYDDAVKAYKSILALQPPTPQVGTVLEREKDRIKKRLAAVRADQQSARLQYDKSIAQGDGSLQQARALYRLALQRGDTTQVAQLAVAALNNYLDAMAVSVSESAWLLAKDKRNDALSLLRDLASRRR
jgi:hypothetical protein